MLKVRSFDIIKTVKLSKDRRILLSARVREFAASIAPHYSDERQYSWIEDHILSHIDGWLNQAFHCGEGE